MNEVVIAVVAGSFSLILSVITAVLALISKKPEVKITEFDKLTDSQRQFADRIMKDNDETRHRLFEAEQRIHQLEKTLRENGITIP